MAFTTWMLLIFCSFQLLEPGYGREVAGRRGRRGTLKSTSPSSYLAYLNIGRNEWNNEIYCAGALVSASYVLTAASCAREEVKIVLGKDSSNPDLQSTFTVSNQDFISNGPLALVKLPKPAKINQAVHPIPLSKKAEYDNLRFLGWRKPRSSPDYKAYGFNVAVVEREQCQKQYKSLSINETNLCIERKNERDYCIGTSGAILFDSTLRKLIAIGHRRYEGCRKNKPLVITNIKSYREWILKNIDSDPTENSGGGGEPDASEEETAMENNGTVATDPLDNSEENSATENSGTGTTVATEISEGDNNTEANETATTGVPGTSERDRTTEANGVATANVTGASDGDKITNENGTATTGGTKTSKGDKTTEGNGTSTTDDAGTLDDVERT